MGLVVEPWAPEYGDPTEDLGYEPEPPDLEAEVLVEAWAPRTPAVGPAATVFFVDGVQRVDAGVIDPVTGRRGRCVSFGAGAVRCDGAATIVATEVRQELFAPDPQEPLKTSAGTYAYVRTADDPRAMVDRLHERMATLEAEVSSSLPLGPDDLLVADGPLSGRRHGVHRAVGYVKTHHASYLPPELAERVVGRLEAGQRTPVFRLGGHDRPSWYLRLPGRIDYPWSGIVRCEAEAAVTGEESFALADRVTATLPAFASQGHKDKRAPQNLYPIGGLEQRLRHLLGDRELRFRALLRAS